MTREERQQRLDVFFEKEQRRKQERENFKSLYKTLSYRDRLLLRYVVDFLKDNPEEAILVKG